MFLYFIFTFIFILFLKSLVRKGKTLTCELGGVGAIGSCLLSAAWRLLGRVHAATALFLWRVLLTECDLAECDLTECDLAGCDLVECGLAEHGIVEYNWCQPHTCNIHIYIE